MKTFELQSILSVGPMRSHCLGISANPSGIKSILFPIAAEKRSRKVVPRSNARSAGKYPSWKMRRMIHWESVTDLNAFRLLECDPTIRSYSEQPARSCTSWTKCKGFITPTFLLRRPKDNSSGKLSSDPMLRSPRSSRGRLFFSAPFRQAGNGSAELSPSNCAWTTGATVIQPNSQNQSFEGLLVQSNAFTPSETGANALIDPSVTGASWSGGTIICFDCEEAEPIPPRNLASSLWEQAVLQHGAMLRPR
jgi:hypothetical protein